MEEHANEPGNAAAKHRHFCNINKLIPTFYLCQTDHAIVKVVLGIMPVWLDNRLYVDLTMTSWQTCE